MAISFTLTPGRWIRREHNAPGGRCHGVNVVERWVAGRLGGPGRIDHERRVREIAGRLFDLTHRLHGMGTRELRLLRLGAIVHDVGRSVCWERHELEGARMILADSRLPLRVEERRHLAYLTRYHRGAVPDEGKDEVLCGGDDAGRLRMVLGLLRAADGLDSRSLLAAPEMEFGLVGERWPRLRVTCFVEEESALARRVYRRRRKFFLMEEMLGCRMEIDIARATAPARVA